MKNFIIISCTILLSSFGFAQSTWYQIPTGTTNGLNAIDFPSTNVGYIVGQDSTMLKTTDGGQTWNQLGFNGIQLSDFSNDFIGVEFYDVHFADENVGFVSIRASSSMIRTIDGGLNWTAINPMISTYSSVYAWSSTDYLVGGAFGFSTIIKKMVNGVTSTSTFPSAVGNNYGWVSEMSFANPNLGLAAMHSQYFLRTTDAGSTWDTIPTSLPSTSYLTSVVMVDDLLCYAGYNDGGNGLGILKSTDGGLTWQYDANSGTIAQFTLPIYTSVCAAQNGDIYAAVINSSINQPMIFETEDGIAWNYTSVIHPIHDMTSCGTDVTFAAGDNGYLIVNTPVPDLGLLDEADFVDFDVYPNPVSNELTIQNPNAETIELTILDASGRVLKKESAPSGESSIDCSNLTDGMYFVNVKIGSKVGLQRIVKY